MESVYKKAVAVCNAMQDYMSDMGHITKQANIQMSKSRKQHDEFLKKFKRRYIPVRSKLMYTQI